MFASSHLSPAQSTAAQQSSAATQTQQPVEPPLSPAQLRARDTRVTQEAIAHIPMEPGAIIGLNAELNAERNEIGLTVAVMRQKQQTMETVIDALKRSGN